MPNLCVVYGCRASSASKTVTLHTFPKNRKTRNLWTKFVKRTRVWPGPTDASHICSKHFQEQDYVNLMQCKMGLARYLLLKPGAIPTDPEQRQDVRSDSSRSAARKREIIRIIEDQSDSSRQAAGKEETKIIKGSDSTPKMGMAAKPPVRPKNPMMPLLKYRSRVLEEVKMKNPNVRYAEIEKLVVIMWNELDDDVRSTLYNQYDTEKAQYKDAMWKYRRNLDDYKMRLNDNVKKIQVLNPLPDKPCSAQPDSLNPSPPKKRLKTNDSGGDVLGSGADVHSNSSSSRLTMVKEETKTWNSVEPHPGTSPHPGTLPNPITSPNPGTSPYSGTSPHPGTSPYPETSDDYLIDTSQNFNATSQNMNSVTKELRNSDDSSLGINTPEINVKLEPVDTETRTDTDSNCSELRISSSFSMLGQDFDANVQIKQEYRITS